jgi:hypothetical protein
MEIDSRFFGPQKLIPEDADYSGSRFAEVRSALFANPYYVTWGAAEEPPLPVYGVTLARTLRGIFGSGRRWLFGHAAERSVESAADVRWGPDRRGFRRLLHPNGVCLFGKWVIDSGTNDNPYTGYFKNGSEALIIARISTCCTETRRGHYRSLGLVGKLFPTTDPNHVDPLCTANFITQEDLGGTKTPYLNEMEWVNAPKTSAWRRGWGLPILLLTAVALRLADRQPTFRQLYQVAELGKPPLEVTRAPAFMRLTVNPAQKRVDGKGLDYRDEILAQIYEKGDRLPRRTLVVDIAVSDEAPRRAKLLSRRRIQNWKQIGRIVFNEAVASYNGDFVLHFQHPRWRDDRNDPSSTTRRRGSR